MSPETGPVWLQLMTLGLVFNAIALCCDAVWALVAGIARAWFATSPKRMQGMSVTGGVMMIGLGGAMAFASPQR